MKKSGATKFEKVKRRKIEKSPYKTPNMLQWISLHKKTKEERCTFTLSTRISLAVLHRLTFISPLFSARVVWTLTSQALVLGFHLFGTHCPFLLIYLNPSSISELERTAASVFSCPYWVLFLPLEWSQQWFTFVPQSLALEYGLLALFSNFRKLLFCGHSRGTESRKEFNDG